MVDLGALLASGKWRGARRRAGRAPAAYEPARHLAHEVKVGGARAGVCVESHQSDSVRSHEPMKFNQFKEGGRRGRVSVWGVTSVEQ